ncbi:MAG: hypothetical protein HOL31_02020 [Candidatus Scalindua sp.]|nr:hypothetical protein [Candidatus Scalindua sp.]MBT7350548.1 hypothetical protein [candidate division WWE3 bacterium]
MKNYVYNLKDGYRDSVAAESIDDAKDKLREYFWGMKLLRIFETLKLYVREEEHFVEVNWETGQTFNTTGGMVSYPQFIADWAPDELVEYPSDYEAQEPQPEVDGMEYGIAEPPRDPSLPRRGIRREIRPDQGFPSLRNSREVTVRWQGGTSIYGPECSCNRCTEVREHTEAQGGTIADITVETAVRA